MTATISIEVALKALVLSLVVFALVRAGVKPALRWQIRRKGLRLSGRQMAKYKEATRGSALILGALLALLPGLWPEDLASAWRPLVGVVCGSLSVVTHHAVQAALPSAVASVLTGGGVLRGGVSDPEDLDA